MIVLVNYANERYRRAQELNSKTGRRRGGFDEVVSFTEEDIAPEYYEAHKDILSEPRGNGLWLWKPYFILRRLEAMKNEEILFYCDSATYFIRNVKRIFEKKDFDIWVSDLPFIEKQFTKRAAFEKMGCIGDEYESTNQIQASYLAIRKNDFTVSFVKEWLAYCEDKSILSPEPLGDECPEFIAHRDDQSILSLLCKKHGIAPELDPSQFGNVPEKYDYDSRAIFRVTPHKRTYKPFIVSHRTPNADRSMRIKQYLVAVLPRPIAKRLIRTKKS